MSSLDSDTETEAENNVSAPSEFPLVYPPEGEDRAPQQAPPSPVVDLGQRARPPTRASGRPYFRFLDPSNESLISEAVPIEGGNFIVGLPTFEPLDEPDLDDGTPPTEVGLAVMEWWAACNHRSPRECPTGLVRAIEAVSATVDNAEQIRRTFLTGSPNWRRNHAGRFAVAQIQVLVPMIGRATVQPRGNATYGRILRDDYEDALIHEVGEGLVLRGRNATHFDNIRAAQYVALRPGDYDDDDRRAFIDSLALEGIREELRGFAFHLQTGTGDTGYHVETDDGFTRVAVAQGTIGRLLGGLPSDFSRDHWGRGDGTLRLGDWTPDAIMRAHAELRFGAAPFVVWPASSAPSDVRRWLATAPPEAHAVLRMMTARMDIGIAVEPYDGYSTHTVVFADMARFHIRGHQPAPWSPADDEAFRARTIFSDLVRHGYVDEDERAVFFGERAVPWLDDPLVTPYRNRVVAIVDAMVQGVVDDPDVAGRYATVRSALKAMRVANSPKQAASAAAALAVIVSGLERDGERGALAALLKRSFGNPLLRRPGEHGGNWTAVVEEELEKLVDAARAELEAVLGTDAHAGHLGPHQRALAILAMTAHAANPALIHFRRDTETGSVRWPSSLTLTGRGERAGAGAVEAHVIALHMAQSQRGIDQLEAIVRASIDHEEPLVPRDPVTGTELLEDELRLMWTQAPTLDGEPRPIVVATDLTSRNDVSEEEPEPRPSLSSVAPWERAVNDFAAEVRALAVKADAMSNVPAGPDVLGTDPDEWDPDDETVARMLDAVGVRPDSGCDADDLLDRVRRFFRAGVLAYYRAQARS